MSSTQITKKASTYWKTIKVAFPYTIPVLTAFLVIGITYGMLMQTKGYGPLWSGLMSGVAFCGSMQFVAITILSTAFDPLQAFLLSLMVNARHMFYGLSLLEKYKGLGWRRFFCIYTLCDENFSLASSIEPPDDVDRGHFYFTISMLNWSYWVIGSVLGGLIGNLITINTKGLDFALIAFLMVLLLEQLRIAENKIPAVIGTAASIVALLIFKANHFVIPAMVLLLTILVVGRKKICR